MTQHGGFDLLVGWALYLGLVSVLVWFVVRVPSGHAGHDDKDGEADR